jgi:serine/threonine protein kinase
VSPKRAPSQPPLINGFTSLQLLGSGGFADVFLYQQAMPRRQVAVKVLLPDQLSESSLVAFHAEADLMASLSTHPSIVTIYQADISTDGRPYLVMEYCSKPNLEARYKRERLSVAEVLRIGIQVTGAVETAHRAGILHRDIKPANILVTQYNRPALTDFGISATMESASSEQSGGMSIPWSPPESFNEGSSDHRSDVYALAATIYTLLAGRSPFSFPGATNSSMDLISRIQSTPMPPLGRADVPVSIERVLATAMAKDLNNRYTSAMEFGRELQRLQMEFRMSVTAIDVLDDTVPDETEIDEDDGRTRIRSIVSIEQPVDTSTAQRPTPAVVPIRSDAESLVDSTIRRIAPFRLPLAGIEPAESTIRRDPAPAPEEPVQPMPGRKRGTLVGVITAVVLATVLAGGALIIATSGGTSSPTAQNSRNPAPVDPVGSAAMVPTPKQLAGVVTAGSVAFSWKDDTPQTGDSFIYQNVSDPTKSTVPVNITEATVTLPTDPTGRTCLSVWLLRADGNQSAKPATKCAP